MEMVLLSNYPSKLKIQSYLVAIFFAQSNSIHLRSIYLSFYWKCVKIYFTSKMWGFKNLYIKAKIWLKLGLDTRLRFLRVFFFFFSAWTVKSHEFTVQEKIITVAAQFTHLKILKMGPTVLFTHLKNYFATVFSVSAKISCIQTNP